MKNQILYLVITIFLGLFAGCTKDNILITGSQNNLIQEEYGSLLKSASLKSKYIVELNKDFDITCSGLAKKKEKMKVRITGLLKKNAILVNPEETYQSALQGFTLLMTPGEAKKLAGDSNIKKIEADQVVSLGLKNGKGKRFSTPTSVSAPDPTKCEIIPWGVARVGGGIDATGKTVWIIDTGVDLNHPDLHVDAARSRSFLSSTTSPYDEYCHGTHVAGTIAAIKGNGIGVVGVAAGATVVSVRVMDINGFGTISEVISGVDYVAAYGSEGDVANMSLTAGDSPILDSAVLAASETGIFFVLAAGNSTASATSISPGRVNGTNVFTVSAMDINDTFAPFSNFGNPTVDFCAPGVTIYSTYPGGYYATMMGTSMAAPHVAGLLLIGAINTDGYVLGDPDGTPDPIAHH